MQLIHLIAGLAVTAAYDSSGLELGRGFHATNQGDRYTLSETVRRTVLDRLLALNHQSYENEVKASRHDKGPKKGKTAKTKSPGASPKSELLKPPQPDLFG